MFKSQLDCFRRCTATLYEQCLKYKYPLPPPDLAQCTRCTRYTLFVRKKLLLNTELHYFKNKRDENRPKAIVFWGLVSKFMDTE